MAFSAVLEIGDNEVKRYYKQYLLTDLRLVLDRSYTVIPEGVARCERLELTVVAPGLAVLQGDHLQLCHQPLVLVQCHL